QQFLATAAGGRATLARVAWRKLQRRKVCQELACAQLVPQYTGGARPGRLHVAAAFAGRIRDKPAARPSPRQRSAAALAAMVRWGFSSVDDRRDRSCEYDVA